MDLGRLVETKNGVASLRKLADHQVIRDCSTIIAEFEMKTSMAALSALIKYLEVCHHLEDIPRNLFGS